MNLFLSKIVFLHFYLESKRMSTLGCGSWENSQTTWDYRKNHDLDVSHVPTLYPYQNIVPGMANRYHNPRRTLHDISAPHLPEKRYSVGHITTNNIVVNPNGNGYVTATIRRNNLPKSDNKKPVR